MLSFISIFASLVISFSGLLSLSIDSTSSLSVFASIFHFSGNSPTNIGIENGKLTSCPDSPNCVVSQTDDQSHYIEPLTYSGDRQEAYDNFVKILSVVPNTQITEQTKNYIRAQSTSKIMGFIDDSEFYFPPNEQIIHWRSASRLGESDLGVNRRRLEQIRLAFNDFTNNN